VVGVRLVSPRRSRVARFAAPAAFLLVATIAILIVRSATSEPAASGPQPANVPRTRATAEPTPTRVPPRPTPANAEFYEIEAEDTLEDVAARFGTTVERLLVLNPDLDPVALRIGQRIRVK
jgi:LysM repeat protein